MKQNVKNKKEWQSVLLWSLVISGLLFFVVVARLHLDLSAKQNHIVYFIPLSFFFLWGAIIGVLFNESKVKKVLKKKFV
ncbi:MAG: hypothetical protein EOM19_08495, partial [Candidatus Moranbacteria bacterium]|nr:hypothetical protein [Candidatus Moranbacteria bacterium]